MGNDILETNLVAASTHNFKVYRGDNWTVDLVVVDNVNAPIDLSGADIKMQIKNKPDDATAVKELNLTNGISVGGDDNNVITIDSEGDLDVRPNDYVYDLQVTYSGGRVVTYLRGSFSVVKDITR
jgi:hypothetical protein